MSFFESSTIKITTPVILLVDASGSVLSQYGGQSGNTVFDRQSKFAKTIPAEHFRVIFWNSNITGRDFSGGIIKFPHVIKHDALNQPFMVAKSKITSGCLTYPHLGFQNIDPTWIDPKETTHIYFLTDGQIGPGAVNGNSKYQLENRLGDEIRNLITKNANIQLHIISFQNENIDFSRLESMNNMVGNDVYSVISSKQLTKSISEFVTFTPNKDDGYSHIQNLIVPKGFISYGTQYFYEHKMPEFTRWIYKQIQDNRGDEQELLKIIQKLSITIQGLSVDKAQARVDGIISTFCNMFHETAVDTPMAHFILTDAIQRDAQGQAFVYAQYRQQLRQLYQQAQQLLHQSTKNAIGLNSQFVSLPLQDVVITGHHNLVTQTCPNTGKNSYPFSSVSVQDGRYIIPVVPKNPLVVQDNSINMQEQCMRQYLRMIFNKIYGLGIMDDIMMYIMMGTNLRARLMNDVPDDVLGCYRKLTAIMLHKRRQHSDVTELTRIEEGNLPTPNNGKITDFYEFMRLVRLHLFQDTLPDLSPMTMWYALCLATANEKLTNGQLIHCIDSIKTDFPDLEDPKLLLDKLANMFREKAPIIIPKIVELRPKLDYSCIITLENTEATGGYLIKPHHSMSGQSCSPQFVLSETGYHNMISQANIWCPQCYQELDINSFDKVDPVANAQDDAIFDLNTPNPFRVHGNNVYKAPKMPQMPQGSPVSKRKNKNNNQNQQGDDADAVPSSEPAVIGKHGFGDKTVVVVLMGGTIGAGKTTFSGQLESAMKERGWAVLNEGTDKYCVTGMSMDQAFASVQNRLTNIVNMPDERVLVIIDTCGQQGHKNATEVFGIDFTGCKMIKYMPNYIPARKVDYMAWTLRNVLNRGPSSADTPYWINPTGAGVKTCVDVHRKKAQMAISYGKNISNKATIEDIKADIAKRADSYQNWLDQNMKMDAEVVKVISNILE